MYYICPQTFQGHGQTNCGTSSTTHVQNMIWNRSFHANLRQFLQLFSTFKLYCPQTFQGHGLANTVGILPTCKTDMEYEVLHAGFKAICSSFQCLNICYLHASKLEASHQDLDVKCTIYVHKRFKGMDRQIVGHPLLPTCKT